MSERRGLPSYPLPFRRTDTNRVDKDNEEKSPKRRKDKQVEQTGLVVPRRSVRWLLQGTRGESERVIKIP